MIRLYIQAQNVNNSYGYMCVFACWRDLIACMSDKLSMFNLTNDKYYSKKKEESKNIPLKE